MIKKIIHRFLNIFGYKILKKEDVPSIRLDDFNEYLNKNKKNDLSDENFLAFIAKNYGKSHSQIYQDLFVDFILNKKDGFYCEVGAFDGVKYSNTLYLKDQLNWKGILCEPQISNHDKIKINRPNDILIKEPIFSKIDEEVLFTELGGGRSFLGKKNDINNENLTYRLKTITLNRVLEDYLKYGEKLNYLSVDTEGTEYEIIKNLNFEKYYPEVITIEHNYNKKNRNKIYNLLKSKNYTRLFKSLSRFDDWYFRPINK